MIEQRKQGNMTVYRLENEELAVTVVPERGGKTISIYHKPAEFELLFQRADFGQREVAAGSRFGQGDACGFDDAFPGIDEEQVRVGGRLVTYPDHGEIWSSPMELTAVNDDTREPSLTLAMDSRLLPYHYQKKIQLTGSHQITYSYQIQNTGSVPIPCLWACHCLVRYEEDMRLIYPEGTKLLENVMDSAELGRAGSLAAYPGNTDGSGYDYRTVAPKQPPTMLKYYVKGRTGSGVCGYDYPTQRMQCRFHYDFQKLPYLGFWLTAGGYQGDYNCAFEPSNGYYDNIATARKNHACYSLEPDSMLQFDLSMELTQNKE